MQYDGFLALVQERANLNSHVRAAAITRATLETLAERVQGDTANNLASQLPPELAMSLRRPPGSNGERFPVDEFTRRVAERADLEPDQAIVQLRAVLRAVRAAVTEGETNHLWAELPGEFLSLFEESSAMPPGKSAIEAAPDDRGRH